MESKSDRHCSARLYAILARDAPIGVIFRRGPSKRVRLIKWHTDSDHLEAGQWFHGRIYEKRSDLSPDGSLLVYFAAKYKPGSYSWTAISRPPYLTALSRWLKNDCWWGGGLFLDDETLWLNHRPNELSGQPVQTPSTQLRVVTNAEACGEDYPIESRRWRRDGWVLIQEAQVRNLGEMQGYRAEHEEVWHRRQSGSQFVLELRLTFNEYRRRRQYRVLIPTVDKVYWDGRAASWADWDQHGRLIFARGGKLFAARTDVGQSLTEREIADLNDMNPEAIESPHWAKVW